MANSSVRQAILNSFTEELDNWLKIEGGYTNGYDYETGYAQFIKSISQKILQQSVGPIPQSRNSKKNFCVVLEKLK